jgi:urea transport system permease protein
MRAARNFLTAFVAAFLLLAAAPFAHAATFAEALALFASDKFPDTEAAIAGVAASGDPQAARVIEALKAGKLVFDPATKTVYIKAASGETLDAATGQPAPGAPATLKTVRVNNKLRGAVNAALGGLTLL